MESESSGITVFRFHLWLTLLAEGEQDISHYQLRGPYDQRLGYSRIPAFKERLSQNHYRVKSQAVLSEEHRKYVASGFFPIYEEKVPVQKLLLVEKLVQIIKTEKVSYKGWQKIFGRSIAHHAPSALEGELTRKAGYARGRCERISTFQTALSQMCLCGAKRKKPLSQRMHHCDNCGLEAPRDIFSAYLAIFCHKEIDKCGNEKWSLNLDDAKAMFRGHRYLSKSGTNAAPIRSDGKPSKACTSDSTTIARGSSSKMCDPILESFWQSFASEESGADLST
ncbi:MAG: hypothetical protein ACOH5I_08165 [Oligoflexus sp.]